MANGNTYEKTNYRERIKDILILFSFILASLFASLIVMDLIIFPLCLFAINGKEIFNFIFVNSFWALLAGIVFYLVGRKIYILRKDEVPNRQIIMSLLSKPLIGFLLFLATLLVIFILIYVIYYIMEKNQYIIYKIISS